MQTAPQHFFPAAGERITGEDTFIRSVYRWMFGGLTLTTLAAFWVASSAGLQRLLFDTPGLALGLFVAEIVLVFVLSAAVNRLTPPTAAAMFLVYSLLNGFTLSSLALVYATSEIFQAFATAALMFAAMSIYGFATKKDLTSWGAFLFMALIGLVIASFISHFSRWPEFTFTVTVMGVFVFLGLTAWDTQKLKTLAATVDEEHAASYAVVGALSLYLDFLNIFLMSLRLFGRRERR